MELNPNHRVTNAARDQWHAAVALLLMKFGVEEVVITEADVAAFAARGPMAVVWHDGINAPGAPAAMRLRLVPMAEAERLARKEGGLPA